MYRRKITTLIVALVAVLSLQAQGFVFQFQGEDLTDGETVVITAQEDLFGDLSCETSSLVLTLLRGTTATVTATLEVTSNSLATLRATVGIESHQVNILFVNGDVDGIKPLSQRRDGARAVYDLRGRRVQGRLPAGMYIVTEGERVRKVAIK